MPADFGLLDTLTGLTSNSGDLTAIEASVLGSSAFMSPLGESSFTSALALYSPSKSVPFGLPKHDNPFDLPDGLPVLTSNLGDLTETDASALGRDVSISPSGIVAFTSALAVYSPSKSVPFGFPKHDIPADFGLPDTLTGLTSNSGDLTAIEASALGSSTFISPSGVSTFKSALALYSPSKSVPFGLPKHDNPH